MASGRFGGIEEGILTEMNVHPLSEKVARVDR